MDPDVRQKGLAAILTDCLAIDERDELLVIYDETSELYAKLLAQLALDLGPSISLFHVPQEQQRRLVAVSYTHLRAHET